jgi:Rrf2 family protein
MLFNNGDCQTKGVPRRFLEKIIRDLLRYGLIKFKRGPRGGYALARSPEQISFYEVIQAIEGAAHRSQRFGYFIEATPVGKEKR